MAIDPGPFANDGEARAAARAARLVFLEIAEMIDTRKPWSVGLLEEVSKFCRQNAAALGERA